MQLKELRQEKGLTQSEVAKAINTSQRNIGRWENGENEPTASFIVQLATYFNVSADYLLGLEDDFGAPTANAIVEGSGYSSEERKLVENYRELNQSGKRLINETIKTLLTTSAGSERKLNG